MPGYPTHVHKRDLVSKLAASEPIEALEVARSIHEPWYRCQALAQVAWHLKDRKQFETVTHEALKAAYEQDEPNRIVSVASWPVRAMVARGDRRLESTVDGLLHKIQLEPNPVRRGDALLMLFEAVYYESRLRDLVLDALLRTCEEMNSWKRPIIMSDIALVLAQDDLERADKIVDMIGEGRKSRQARRAIAEGKWLGPHEFFPYYAKPAPSG
jgi:hypothetical protein